MIGLLVFFLTLLKGIVEYCLGETSAWQWFLVSGVWYVGWRMPTYIKPKESDVVVDD